MILRAIEEGRFLPVGADKEVASDFQLIAGTNRNLVEAVSEGRFREDLFARLNLWTFTLPGLAARFDEALSLLFRRVAIRSFGDERLGARRSPADLVDHLVMPPRHLPRDLHDEIRQLAGNAIGIELVVGEVK